MYKMTAKQGESTDLFYITIKDLVDYTDYYGDFTLINPETNAVVLGPIRINPADNKFSVALSSLQTTGLPIDNYTAVFEVVKDVLGVIEFKKELSWAVKITASLLPS